MWLFTDIGMFSIVEKPGDRAAGRLTVRARCREDLERLRDQHLAQLGRIIAGGGTDYQFRATAPRAAIGRALAAMVGDIDYPNFKQAVLMRHGVARERVYEAVWWEAKRIGDV